METYFFSCKKNTANKKIFAIKTKKKEKKIDASIQLYHLW